MSGSGMWCTIAGKVKRKASGRSEKTGREWFQANIVFEGGNHSLYFDDRQDYEEFPSEGSAIVVKCEMEIDKNDKTRLSDPVVEKQAAARAAA